MLCTLPKKRTKQNGKGENTHMKTICPSENDFRGRSEVKIIPLEVIIHAFLTLVLNTDE
jgi:hypothetical protein